MSELQKSLDRFDESVVRVIEDLTSQRKALRARIAELEGERDAAKAEAARVSLANKKIRAIDENGNPTMRWSEIDEVARQAIAQPALVWLAQVKREAAAEELEKVASEVDAWGSDGGFTAHYHAAFGWCVETLRSRAAALRAGKVQNAE